jgi:hypothetical protein
MARSVATSPWGSRAAGPSIGSLPRCGRDRGPPYCLLTRWLRSPTSACSTSSACTESHRHRSGGVL